MQVDIKFKTMDTASSKFVDINIITYRERRIWFVLIGTVLIVHALTLLRYPPPFVDDAVMGNRAWEFLRSGTSFGVLDRGVFDRFEGYSNFWPFLPAAIQSIGFLFSKSPSILALRSISFVFGILLIIFVFVIGKYFGGERLGLVSVLLMLITKPFFVSSHLGRMDIIVASMGLAAITLILYFQNKNWLFSLVAGLIAGLAFEVHPYSLIYIFVIEGLLFFEYRKRILYSSSFWAFNFGVLIGFIVFIYLHILPNPASYFEAMKLADGGVHTPPILTINPRLLLNSAYSAIVTISNDNLVILLLLYLGIFKLDLSNNKKHQQIGLIVVVLFVAYILLFNNKIFYYSILISPALVIIASIYLITIQERIINNSIGKLFYPLIWGLTIIVAILTLRVLTVDFWTHYNNVQSEINRHIQKNDLVMGNQLYWFGLYQNDYYSWEALIFYQRYDPESDLEEALLEFKPDILIIDQHISQFITDSDGTIAYQKALKLPETQTNSLLSKYGNLITEFDGGVYGLVRIYRFNWENSKSYQNPTRLAITTTGVNPIFSDKVIFSIRLQYFPSDV